MGAIPFNSPSELLSEGGKRFREVIKPNAMHFSEVRALLNHQSYPVLGRLSKGTLKLEQTDSSMNVSLDTPRTTAGNDLIESVDRGDIAGLSFAFRVNDGGESWSRQDGQALRTLTDITISEVSFVGSPAYPDTTVALRSLDVFEKSENKKEIDMEILKKKQRQAECS